MALQYNTLNNATVPGSKVESIQQHNSTPQRYRIKHYAGNRRYSDKVTIVEFAHSGPDGKFVPGLLPEQLILVIKDYLSHQDEVNPEQIDACNKFLEASTL